MINEASCIVLGFFLGVLAMLVKQSNENWFVKYRTLLGEHSELKKSHVLLSFEYRKLEEENQQLKNRIKELEHGIY